MSIHSEVFISPAFPTTDVVLERIALHVSTRPVRPVVTRSGHRARGRFPSVRFSQTRYESLVEEDALRVMELATLVVDCKSHPFVIRLTDTHTGKDFDYTPDQVLTLEETTVLIEVKGDWLLKLEKPRASLLRIARGLKQAGIPFAVLPESEIRANDLQLRLKELLMRRPVGARRMTTVDKSVWDPLCSSPPSAEDLRQWREAQEECNSLLRRVMGRDPEDFIECCQE